MVLPVETPHPAYTEARDSHGADDAPRRASRQSHGPCLSCRAAAGGGSGGCDVCVRVRLRSCSRAISASTRCTLFSPATGTHLCRMHARLHLCTLVTPLPLSLPLPLPLPLPSTGTGPRSARVCVQCRSADGVAFVLSTTRPLCSDTVRCHISLVACCMPYVACCMLRVNAARSCFALGTTRPGSGTTRCGAMRRR